MSIYKHNMFVYNLIILWAQLLHSEYNCVHITTQFSMHIEDLQKIFILAFLKDMKQYSLELKLLKRIMCVNPALDKRQRKTAM